MAVTIQLRGDTAANWLAVDPVLAEREFVIETDTLLYKIGNGTAKYSALPYRLLAEVFTVNTFAHQAAHPSTPAPGTMKVYAKDLGGKMCLRVIGPSGISTPLQPSLYQNMIATVNTGTGATLYVFGTGITAVGTISHPVHNEDFGYMWNQVTAATAGATAGNGNANLMWMRGTVPGKANGFFFNARVGYPDVDYNWTAGVTGSRTFCGLTANTLAAQVGSDEPVGNFVGFQRCHSETGRRDTNWMFQTKDSLAATLIDTGLPFIATRVYDVYIFCPPAGDTIYWRIDNVNDGTSAEGSVSTNLPGSNDLMRAGCQLQTINAQARNIRMQRIYTESDR